MSKLNTAMLTHHSYWIRDVPARKRFEKLSGTHKTDIAIIGAGVTGLSTAIELLDRGNKVTVVEALEVGGGTTGGPSGQLDAHPEGGPKHFIKAVGETTAVEATKFRLDAIDLSVLD